MAKGDEGENQNSVYSKHSQNPSSGEVMDEALVQIGLPVSCAYGDCEVTGYVKPASDYGGWYKSKLFRFKRKRWYCPEHYEKGRAIDNKFYENFKTPDPYPAEEVEATVDELYKLLD